MSNMDELDDIFQEEDLVNLLEEVQKQENETKKLNMTEEKAPVEDKPKEKEASMDTRSFVESVLEGMDLDEEALKSLGIEPEKKALDMGDYDSSVYASGQLEEIRIGLEHGLDVSLYDSEEMSYRQMQEIRLGLERNLNVSFYANKYFRERQMHEIRLGLEEGLDVSDYARLMYSGTDMKEKRLKLFLEKYQESPDSFDHTYTDIDTGIQVSTERNLMIASIKLTKKLPEDYTKHDLKKLLELSDINYGIDLSNIPDQLSEMIENKKYVIAKGEPSSTGKDGYYEYMISKVSDPKPKIREDGSVDYAVPKEYTAIKRGQKVAIYHPATCGKNGTTVTGNEIKAIYGKQEPSLDCNDIKLLSDKVTYVAEKDGYISYYEDRILIMDYLVIDHDIGYGNGNIRFDGNIKILGSIHENVYVDATGDIVVDGFVESAKLTAGRDIIIRRGVNGDERGVIEAKRNVVAAFFENAIVTAGGTVEAGYILNSRITCEDTVKTSGRKSIICGGTIKAGNGVITGVIGSRARTRSNIEIGKKTNLTQELNELNEKKVKAEDEMNQLRSAMNVVLAKLGALQGRNNPVYLKLKNMLEQKKVGYLELTKEIGKLESRIKNSKKIFIQATNIAYENTRVSVNGNVKLLSEDAKNARFTSNGREILIG